MHEVPFVLNKTIGLLNSLWSPQTGKQKQFTSPTTWSFKFENQGQSLGMLPNLPILLGVEVEHFLSVPHGYQFFPLLEPEDPTTDLYALVTFKLGNDNVVYIGFP